MIRDVDVRFVAPDLFASMEFIPDESQFAEDPTPDPKEEISHRTETEEKRQGKARQEDNHENAEDYTNPDDIERVKKFVNASQNRPIKLPESWERFSICAKPQAKAVGKYFFKTGKNLSS